MLWNLSADTDGLSADARRERYARTGLTFTTAGRLSPQLSRHPNGHLHVPLRVNFRGRHLRVAQGDLRRLRPELRADQRPMRVTQLVGMPALASGLLRRASDGASE